MSRRHSCREHEDDLRDWDLARPGPRAAQVAPLAAVYAGGDSPGTDPHRAARFILDVTDLDDPPLHLPLGESAFRAILAAEQRRMTELTDWEQVSRSAGS